MELNVTSTSIQCHECGNVSRMEIVAEYRRIITFEENTPHAFDAGDVYQLALCGIPDCNAVTLLLYQYNDGIHPENPMGDAAVLYPPKKPSLNQ